MWPFKSKEKKKVSVHFTGEQMRNIFKNAFGNNCQVMINDEGYLAIPHNDFMGLVRQRGMEPNYCLNLYDCSRFTIGFFADISRIWANKTWGNWPLAFGMARVRRVGRPNHALIVQIDDKGIIHFIEPQSDSKVDGKDLEPYFIEA